MELSNSHFLSVQQEHRSLQTEQFLKLLIRKTKICNAVMNYSGFLRLISVFVILSVMQGVPAPEPSPATDPEMNPRRRRRITGKIPSGIWKPESSVLKTRAAGGKSASKPKIEQGTKRKYDKRNSHQEAGQNQIRAHSAEGNKMQSRAKNGSSNVNTTKTEGSAACFPARALVQVHGKDLRMDELHVGDKIRTGPLSYSDVFVFSHATKSEHFEFVQLRTHHGTLTASPGHLVHTRRGKMCAREVAVGDFLIAVDGHAAQVRGVKRVMEEGLYNPQTLDGEIVVDGFVVTTFTEAVPMAAAAAMLSPMRATYGILGVDATMGLIGRQSVVRTAAILLLSVVRAISAHALGQQ